MTLKLSAVKLKQHAATAGLHCLAISDLAPLENGRKRLLEWQRAGFAGELEFMRRDAELLSLPGVLAPWARSGVLFAVYYDRAPAPPNPGQCGRVARYAWGEDYHRVLPVRVKALVRAVESELGVRIAHHIFSDAVPILEREWAQASGLGFFGKNTMLIQPRRGSYFFIAELLWQVEVEGDSEVQNKGGCGSCRDCICACPTEALVSEYRLDARKCISYLTIEKEGLLSRHEAGALGEWVFGCDICQEVCAFNHAPLKRAESPGIDRFAARSGSGPWIDLAALLAMRSANQFRKVFGNSALMRAGRERMLRNGCAVAANMGFVELLPLIAKCALEDRSELVRAQALQTIRGFKSEFGEDSGRSVFEQAKSDTSLLVQGVLSEDNR